MRIVFAMKKLEKAPTQLLLNSLQSLEPSVLPLKELEFYLLKMIVEDDWLGENGADPYSIDLSLDVVEVEALESMVEVLRLARAQILDRHGPVFFTLLFIHLIEIHTIWSINDRTERGEMAYAH